MFPGVADFDLSVNDHARAAGPPHALVVRLVILLHHQSLPRRARGPRIVARLTRLPEPATASLALRAGLAEGVGGEDSEVGRSGGFGDDCSSMGGVRVEVDRPGRGSRGAGLLGAVAAESRALSGKVAARSA